MRLSISRSSEVDILDELEQIEGDKDEELVRTSA
jgi:hypothetical protein